MEDNATINANAYGVAINTWGNVKATGGKIIAKSSRSNGIFAEQNIEIKNIKAEVEGYHPAHYGKGGVSVENSKVTAEADDVAIYSPAKVSQTVLSRQLVRIIMTVFVEILALKFQALGLKLPAMRPLLMNLIPSPTVSSSMETTVRPLAIPRFRVM